MDLKIDHKKSTIADVVTASIGLVTINCSYQYTTNDILEKADRLLYEAKNSGRNQTKYQEIF
jgi:diguanylate cyclase (GGDEF)-like protein